MEEVLKVDGALYDKAAIKELRSKFFGLQGELDKFKQLYYKTRQEAESRKTASDLAERFADALFDVIEERLDNRYERKEGGW